MMIAVVKRGRVIDPYPHWKDRMRQMNRFRLVDPGWVSRPPFSWLPVRGDGVGDSVSSVSALSSASCF